MLVSRNQTIERFAAICAQLDDGFADRALILGTAGFDESSWKRLETGWTTQIAEGSDGSLARRFGEAYAAARGPRSGLPFSSANVGEECGIRPEPAQRRIYEPPIRPASSATDATESTIEVPVFAQRPPVLPFVPPRPPCRRLHRFDTQTGLPLPNPIWIDDANDADSTKSA